MNKMSKLFGAGVLCLSLSVFFACQKNVSDPLLTSAAKGGGTTTISGDPVFDLSVPDADVTCATSTSYCFNASLLNHGGQTMGGQTTISAKIVDGSNNVLFTAADLNSNQGSVCFSDLALAAGTYTVVVSFDHVPSENAQKQHGSFSFPLTVQADGECGTTTCQTTGLLFNRTPVIVTNASLTPLQVNVTYSVTNCTEDQTFNNLKIQGGLVNKASEPVLTPGGTGLILSYEFKKTSGNYIITGYFNLAPHQNANFTVSYTVAAGCNSPLTGEWSVKNGPVPVLGTGLSTTNPYYVNRLEYVCQ